MRVLVTGGAGFIGSHLADRFTERGERVAVVDNLYSGFRHNLDPTWEFHELDIVAETLGEVFAGFKPDLVVHAAAQVRVRCEDHLLDARYNVLGSLNVFHRAAESGVRRLIYLSSGGAVYGVPRYLPCDEEHPIDPVSAYGVSKYTPELYLRLFAESHGLDYVVLRPGNVYGPRQDQRGEAGVCALFTGAMLAGEPPVINGDGENTRDYVFVDDVVKAVVAAVDNLPPDIPTDDAARRTFNVATGREASVNTIYNELARLTGFSGEPRHAPEPREVKRIALGCSRIQRELGWTPAIELEEGLRRLVDWTKDNKKC